MRKHCRLTWWIIVHQLLSTLPQANLHSNPSSSVSRSAFRPSLRCTCSGNGGMPVVQHQQGWCKPQQDFTVAGQSDALLECSNPWFRATLCMNKNLPTAMLLASFWGLQHLPPVFTLLASLLSGLLVLLLPVDDARGAVCAKVRQSR